MPFSTSMSSIHFHLPSCFMIHFLYLPSMRGGFFYFLFARIHFRTYQPKIPPPTKYGIPTARPITANTARKATAQTTIQSSGIYRKHLSFMLNLLDGWGGKTPTHAFCPIFLHWIIPSRIVTVFCCLDFDFLLFCLFESQLTHLSSITRRFDGKCLLSYFPKVAFCGLRQYQIPQMGI